MIDRRLDPKSDMGNFELAYRQVVPPTPAYMGLNLFVKGKQLLHKVNHGHGHYYYQQQRKERSLATSSVFRQRSAIIPATTMSRIHRAMPTFNATEYMEKYMVEPLSSSRSSISSTQQQQQSATTTTFNTLKSPTVGSIAAPSSPCPYLLKQAGRSISQLLSATQKRNTTSNNASGGMELNMNASLPPKRQRSCGPRFATNQVESTEKKFKILIKNYASNTAANLLEKQEPPSSPATAPVISERKWRSLRNINGTTSSSTTTTTTTVTSTCSRSKQMTTSSLLESSHCSRRFARTKSEIESSASMHAIGRTFGRKSNGPRLPISISVQALHRGEPILSAMKQATSELQLSQSQIVSPRTALANKLNNSTLTVPLPTC